MAADFRQIAKQLTVRRPPFDLRFEVREHGRGQGVEPKGGSDIEYAGLHKNLAPGVDGSRSALNRGSAADLLL